MASSKVMKTSSTTTRTIATDLHHNNYTLNHNYTQMIPTPTPADVSLDNLFSSDGEITMIDAAGAIECPDAATIRRKTAEDVWREIVDGGDRKECKVEDGMMTLEDFMARATAEEMKECKVEDEMMTLEDFLARATAEEMEIEVGVKEEEYTAGVTVAAAGGRGKRSRGGGGVVMESLDKATQQRQRRMIKNRESAARSRERKQAYLIELEALAAKLEEENELLRKEKADRTKQRYQQLMEKIVPVVEKRRTPRSLRRVHSMQW